MTTNQISSSYQVHAIPRAPDIHLASPATPRLHVVSSGQDRLDELNNKINDLESSLVFKYQGQLASTQQPKDKVESWWSVTEAMTISSVILIFFLFVMILATYAIKHGTKPEAVLRLFGTISIVCVATFLIVAGYDDKQIAPVIGLLGTIVGYLLGKDVVTNPSDKRDDGKSSYAQANDQD